eukprot:CAMPEP_0170528192 /NCGR_PEP_ID=MMETSP0209-20121228/13697_1 /TAXON_ID=665100 ORGANISM="Litonotus pictus, Strain P1" /NCGR_SAMPLE_ID=MMETSP0209 /ASSEMBLY_ACC=CAM_ASM_000301 /LENGTH=61 /DNA_ID=CAMNT_0010819255 /DNA_START=111 /DNA_END=293 /DNA_ORIENTATION=+
MAKKQLMMEENQRNFVDYMNSAQKSDLSKYKKNSKLAELKAFKIGSLQDDKYKYLSQNNNI